MSAEHYSASDQTVVADLIGQLEHENHLLGSVLPIAALDAFSRAYARITENSHGAELDEDPAHIEARLAVPIRLLGDTVTLVGYSREHLHNYTTFLGASAAVVAAENIVLPGDAEWAPGSNRQHTPHSHGRVEYHRTYSLAIATEGNELMRAMAGHHQIHRIPDGKLDEHWIQESSNMTDPAITILASLHPSSASLLLAGHAAAQAMPNQHEVHEAAQVSDIDNHRANENSAFDVSLGDLTFPWHFTIGLASSVASILARRLVITHDEKDAVTLTDWADMIESEWFSHLAHILAMAPNGTYGPYGQDLLCLDPDDLKETLIARKKVEIKGDIFEPHEFTSADGTEKLLGAVPTPELLNALRQILKTALQSGGCPVVRKTTMLPNEQVASDPHTRRLIDQGIFKVVPERSTATHVRVTTEETPITKTLRFIAGQLRQYENLYGIPVLTYRDTATGLQTDREPRVHHTRRPYTSLFRKPA